MKQTAGLFYCKALHHTGVLLPAHTFLYRTMIFFTGFERICGFAQSVEPERLRTKHPQSANTSRSRSFKNGISSLQKATDQSKRKKRNDLLTETHRGHDTPPHLPESNRTTARGR